MRYLLVGYRHRYDLLPMVMLKDSYDIINSSIIESLRLVTEKVEELVECQSRKGALETGKSNDAVIVLDNFRFAHQQGTMEALLDVNQWNAVSTGECYVRNKSRNKMVACLCVGGQIVSVSQDGVVAVFRLNGPNTETIGDVLKCPESPINGGVLLADGLRVVLWGDFNYLLCLVVADSQITRRYVAERGVVLQHAAVCGEAVMCVAGSDKSISILDTNLWTVKRVQLEYRVCGMACGRAGAVVYVLNGDNSIDIFDRSAHALVFRRSWVENGGGGEGTLKAMAVSPDGRNIAIGYSSGTVKVYRTGGDGDVDETTVPKTTTGEELRDCALCFDHSSRILAVGPLNTSLGLRLVDLVSGLTFTNFIDDGGSTKVTSSVSFNAEPPFLVVGQANGKVARYALGLY